MKGRAPNSFCTTRKKSAPGPGTHSPVSAVRRPGWHVPSGRERAEVIEANQINMSQQAREAGRSTRHSRCAHVPPSHKPGCPRVALRAEVIGWHSSYETRPALFVQEKQFRVGPHIT